jgi:hypothetical protein
MKHLRLLPLIAALLIPSLAFATTVNFTTSGTWTAPAGVTSVDAQVWGDGGGAGNFFASGGGGGAFSETTNVSVTPGNTYSITVGQGGIAGSNVSFQVSGFSGIGSMFLSSTTVFAQGGGGGDKNSGLGAGGAAASGFGATKHSGGSSNGGGGGGAGTVSDGSSTGGSTPGAPGGSVGGGKGGDSSASGAGQNGSTYGGGGGYGNGGTNAGAGARGEVDLTFTAASGQAVTSSVHIQSGFIRIRSGVMRIGN